jgi:DNA-binding beta-propeller fold protein YncE
MISPVRLVLAALALVAALVSATTAAADKGVSPGVELGGAGVATVDGAFRYVARHRGGLTTVSATDRDGEVARSGSITGLVGIPRVAFDGTLGGLSHDGRRLVLAAPERVSGSSRFVVVSTRDLRPVRTVTLGGTWSFDALSPDGRKLYLVEHAPERSVTYRVRAYDLVRGRLLREAVIDPRLGGRAMTGLPVTQVLGSGGVWAYTLYQKPGGRPFVHALDTVRGKALCIELPWRGNQGRLFDVRMRVSGRSLVLRSLGGAHLATIDTREFVVHAHHNPLRAEAGR